MSFQYNQFKNPNNNNIYYADHTHNIHSGLDIHTDRFNHYNNPIRHADHDPGYHVHNKFNGNLINRKWLIKPTETDNNFPVIRSHVTASATRNMQPIALAAPYVSEAPETTITTNNTSTSANSSRADTSTLSGAESDKLKALSASTIASTEALTLNRPTHISDGIFSYLDLDQNVTTDTYGAREMKLIALKDNGFPDHGKPVQVTTINPTLNSENLKETELNDITTSHIHYFPVRNNVINGYETTHVSGNHVNVPNFPNNKMKNYYSKKSPNLMNFNVHKHYHSSNFRLFR